ERAATRLKSFDADSTAVPRARAPARSFRTTETDVMGTTSSIKRPTLTPTARPWIGRLAKTVSRAWRYRELYLLLLPTLIFFAIFSYVPYGGLLMAFQDFSPRRGVWGSEWVGFAHFEYLFSRAGF